MEIERTDAKTFMSERGKLQEDRKWSETKTYGDLREMNSGK